jgi:hypothetical protein
MRPGLRVMADDRDARITQLGAELQRAREEIASHDRALDAAREQQAASTAILQLPGRAVAVAAWLGAVSSH